MDRPQRLVVSVDTDIETPEALKLCVEAAGVASASIGKVRLTPLKVGWVELSGDLSSGTLAALRRQPGITSAELEGRHDLPTTFSGRGIPPE